MHTEAGQAQPPTMPSITLAPLQTDLGRSGPAPGQRLQTNLGRSARPAPPAAKLTSVGHVQTPAKLTSVGQRALRPPAAKLTPVGHALQTPAKLTSVGQRALRPLPPN